MFLRRQTKKKAINPNTRKSTPTSSLISNKNDNDNVDYDDVPNI
jgi:hypothetical protein